MTRADHIVRLSIQQAEKLRASHGAPHQLNLNLYATDHDLRQLRPEDGPDATAADQRALTERIGAELTTRGFTVRYVTLRAADYLKWLTDNNLPNRPENRAKWSTWQQGRPALPDDG